MSEKYKLSTIRACLEILSMAFQSICRRLDDVEIQGIVPLCLTFLPRRSARQLNCFDIQQFPNSF